MSEAVDGSSSVLSARATPGGIARGGMARGGMARGGMAEGRSSVWPGPDRAMSQVAIGALAHGAEGVEGQRAPGDILLSRE
jgi:hypothetical protein